MKIKLCLLVVILSTSLLLTTRLTTAQLTYLSLPSDSIPLGVAYDGASKVYVAGYWYGALFIIDVPTETYSTKYIRGTQTNGVNPYVLTIDARGDVWMTIRGTTKIAKYTVSTETFTEVDVGAVAAGGIAYHNGYVWVGCRQIIPELGVANGLLVKVDPNTNQVVASYIVGTPEFCPEYNSYVEFSPSLLDGDGDYLWINIFNDPSGFKGFEGKVVKFDITLGVIVKTITGFDRPLGIEVDTGYVYVAENKRAVYGTAFMGTIAKINKATDEVTRIETALVTNEGPYYVLKDSYGNLWWTDNSWHMGVIGPTTQTWNTIVPYCYFMTQVKSQIWFSGVGSAYIGMVDIPKTTAKLTIRSYDTKGNEITGIKLKIYIQNSWQVYKTPVEAELEKGTYQLSAQASQKINGVRYDFVRWEDEHGVFSTKHTITFTLTADANLKAIYKTGR